MPLFGKKELVPRLDWFSPSQERKTGDALASLHSEASEDRAAEFALLERAIDLLRQAWASDQSEVIYPVTLAGYHLKLYRHAEAIRVLERALEINPDHPKLLHPLSTIYSRLTTVTYDEMTPDQKDRIDALPPEWKASYGKRIIDALSELGLNRREVAERALQLVERLLSMDLHPDDRRLKLSTGLTLRQFIRDLDEGIISEAPP